MAHCQCSSQCKKKVVEGTPFCRHHLLKGCGRQSPMSGSEPDYNPDKYNKDSSIRHSHNCFAYAFGVIDPLQVNNCKNTENCAVPFHVPGKESGFGKIDAKTCADTVARTIADSDGGYRIGFTGRCRRGFSKIATVVDPDRDFHYYRQDTNGMWSHKPGAMPVTNKDSAGNPIYDPDLAGRYYPSKESREDELNYTGFCGYYCIPRNKKLTIAGGRRRRAASGAHATTRRKTRSVHKTRRRQAQSSRKH